MSEQPRKLYRRKAKREEDEVEGQTAHDDGEDRTVVIHAPPKLARQVENILSILPHQAATAMADFMEGNLPHKSPEQIYRLFDDYHRQDGLCKSLIDQVLADDEDSRSGYEKCGYTIPRQPAVLHEQRSDHFDQPTDFERSFSSPAALSCPVTTRRCDFHGVDAAGSKDMDECDGDK